MPVTLLDRQETVNARRELEYRLGKRQRPSNVVPFQAMPVTPEPPVVESAAPVDVPLVPTEGETPRYPTMAEIIRAVSVYYGVSIHEIKSARRMKAVVHARHVASYLARELTLMSFPAMGLVVNKDHSSCIHGAYKIKDLRPNDPMLDQDIKNITKMIGGRAHV